MGTLTITNSLGPTGAKPEFVAVTSFEITTARITNIVSDASWRDIYEVGNYAAPPAMCIIRNTGDNPCVIRANKGSAPGQYARLEVPAGAAFVINTTSSGLSSLQGQLTQPFQVYSALGTTVEVGVFF